MPGVSQVSQGAQEIGVGETGRVEVATGLG